MKLLTKEIEKTIPALYNQESKGMDAIVYVKFFTPFSSWTWYATEYDPKEQIFFGYVIGFEREFGYFSLDELESVEGPFGPAIERDLYFKPKPLREALK